MPKTTSQRPDPRKRRRNIEVKITRTGQKWQIWSRKEYVLKAPQPVNTSKQ